MNKKKLPEKGTVGLISIIDSQQEMTRVKLWLLIQLWLFAVKHIQLNVVLNHK